MQIRPIFHFFESFDSLDFMRQPSCPYRNAEKRAGVGNTIQKQNFTNVLTVIAKQNFQTLFYQPPEGAFQFCPLKQNC